MEDLTGLFVVLGIVWFVVALIVGNFGKTRTIGFAGAFYASLLLSPILAMLFIVASDKKPDTGLSSGEKVALFVPLGLILLSIGIGIISSINYNIESAKKYEIEKRIEDSLNVIIQKRQAEIWNKTYTIPKYDTPITEPMNGIWIKYNSNKSISIGGYPEITIPSTQITQLIVLFKKADKLANYCDSINSVATKKLLGNVGGYNFYFNRTDYGSNEISVGDWDIPIYSDDGATKLLTTDRDEYYKQLKAYRDKKKKDEELLSKL